MAVTRLFTPRPYDSFDPGISGVAPILATGTDVDNTKLTAVQAAASAAGLGTLPTSAGGSAPSPTSAVLRFRGPWQANTAYQYGDVVQIVDGSGNVLAYSANLNFTSGSTFNATNWTELTYPGGSAASPTGGFLATGTAFSANPAKTSTINLVAYPTTGNETTLHTLTGAGIIQSLQMTYGDAAMARQLRLRVYVDGEALPSIDVEWGTLVGMQADAFGAGALLSCRHVSASSSGGSYTGTCSGTVMFPIPFAAGAVVKIFNPGVSTSGMTNFMYAACQYQAGAVTGTTDRWRLRSVNNDYRTPLSGTQAVSLPLFDYQNAAGTLVFFANAIKGATNYTFLERCWNLYRDGESTPSYRGNSEDWWGSGFYLGGMSRFSSPVAMVTAANNGNSSFYGGIDLLEMCGGFSFTTELKMAIGTSAEIKGSNFESTNFTAGYAALLYVDTSVPFVPQAPTIGTATPGNTQATVTWTAPPSPGSQPITGFTVTSSPGGFTATVAATATTATVTGLTNGTAYTFTVKATNGVGNSTASAASNSVTPSSGTVPGAPTGLGAAPSNTQNIVTWTAPASNGGSAITNYKVYRSTTTGTETLLTTVGNVLTYTDTGLTNGTTYFYKVSAVNIFGEGALSSEASGTPSGVLVSDTFNRADSTSSLGTADSGQTWTLVRGTGIFGINTNKAYMATDVDNTWVRVPVGVANQTVQADLNASSQEIPGLVARMSTDGQNGYFVDEFPGAGGGGIFRIGKHVAGSESILVSSTAGTAVAGTVYTMKFVVSGSTLSLYINGSGTPTLTTTDSSNDGTVHNGAGMRYGRGTTTGSARWDNFSVS